MNAPSHTSLAQLDPQTDMLLRLLSQVILADGHVMPSEVDALVRGAERLALKDQFGNALTEKNIRDWFRDYQLIVEVEIPALRPDIALTHLILKLADFPDKQVVIDVLTEISVADDDFHDEEKTLISIVRTFWQFEGLDAADAKIEA